MKSNVRYIRKRDFLEALEAIYSQHSTDFLKTLYEGLQIIYCKRLNGNVDFKNYGGFVKI